MSTRADFRLLHRLRVRWAEVDLQGIVFNGHYLMYLDTAMAAYWRALALPYVESLARLGGDLYVRKAGLEYHGSARHDELIDVGLRARRLGSSSLAFEAAVFRGEQRLVDGELVYVFADPATQTSRPLPPALRATIEAYEAGEAMLAVSTGRWDELGAEARAIREEVFVQEQGIAPADEWDEADAGALHAVARNRLGMALATGRLLPHAPGVAKIGRMAVRPALRGGGAGLAVLEALTQAARARGERELLLHAQTAAAGFYARAGFVADGPDFDEVGIPHRAMRRAL